MANKDTLVEAVVKYVEVDYGAWSQGGIPFVGTAVSGADELLPDDMTFTVDDIVYAATYLGDRYGGWPVSGWKDHSYENWYVALTQGLSARMTETPPVIPPVIEPPVIPPITDIIPPVTIPVTSSSKTLLIIGGLALIFLLTRKTGEGA